jgi:TolB protein
MKSKRVSKILLYLLVLFILGNVGVTVYFLLPVFQTDAILPISSTPTKRSTTHYPTNSATTKPTVTVSPIAVLTETVEEIVIPTSLPTATPAPTEIPVDPTATVSGANVAGLQDQGVMVLSLADGAFYHLFAYNPQYLPLLRLTDGESDDVSPAINPDGTKICFSSRRNNAWDLYILDIQSGSVSQLTNTPEYEGSPTWSPDGQWIAFDAYSKAGNLDIYLLETAHPETAPLQLTDDPAADFSPNWMAGGGGRQIAFVSDRSGNDEIWIARLDNFKERFINASLDADSEDTHPVWSPDGLYLSWAKKHDGDASLVIWNSNDINSPVRAVGSGDWPVWNPTGNNIGTRVRQANLTALSSFDINTGQINIPLIRLPGPLQGLDWRSGGIAQIMSTRVDEAPSPAARVIWTRTLQQDPMPSGKDGLVSLDGVGAPSPVLLDTVDDSYIALRSKIGDLVGWDFLNSLTSAFMEKDTPADPGASIFWLSTGRAFEINDLPMNSGWMVLVRDDIGAQVYWRIFLKTRAQDGSQGRPMTERAWDIISRNSGDPTVYEKGGKDTGVPQGYWVDFTEWAGRFGWDRFPALSNWITYYPGARFKLFALTEGLDLNNALGQIYPGETFTRQVNLPTFTPFPTPEATDPTPTAVSKKETETP